MSPRTTAFPLWPGFQVLDVTGPLEAFTLANRFAPGSYCPVLLANSPTPLSSSGLSLGPVQSFFDIRTDTIDTVLVPGGQGVHQARQDPSLLAWITGAHGKVRRLCSVCSGAFLLAETGLLAGRRAVTHWESVPRLAKEFPEIQVEPDAIFCHDGDIWTSAGVTAGIDLALAMIEEDCGRAVALATARELVVYLRRPGGQSQFSAELLAQEKTNNRFEVLMEWLFDNLDLPLDIDCLADRAAMSRRSFQRHFTEAFGTSPAKFVEKARVEAARRDLEASERTIEQIAAARGFQDPERMRRAFQRHLGLAPSDYRARFRAPEHSQPMKEPANVQ